MKYKMLPLTADSLLELCRLTLRPVVVTTFLSLATACTTAPTGEIEPSAGKEPSAKIEPSASEKPRQLTPPSERLLATPPDNWKLVYQLNNKSSRLADYVPPDESEAEWSTKLSFESFRDLINLDPIQILLAEAANDNEHCSFVEHFNLYSGFENNYPASVRLFLCGENTFVSQGEIKMVKAIQGDDYFYLIKILRRIEPFETNQPDFAKKEIAQWSSYLRNISLCNSNKPDHPCPVD